MRSIIMLIYHPPFLTPHATLPLFSRIKPYSFHSMLNTSATPQSSNKQHYTHTQLRSSPHT